MRSACGFTLIELVLVLVLIGILAAVSLPMLTTGFGAFTQQRETAAIEREAMLALDRISREVRLGQDVAAAGASVSLERDGGVSVTISQSGGDLVLDVDGSVSVLARNVSNLSFSAEDLEGACYLLATFDTAGVSQTWRQSIYLRNMSC